MYWWLIVNTTEGLKGIGPFRSEEGATDTLLEYQQLVGDIGYYDIFPSMQTSMDEAVQEWKTLKGG